jgi:hypothetical protein
MAAVLGDDSIELAKVVVMAVFGQTKELTETELHEDVLAALLQEWGRLPDRMLLPSEGNSSIYLQEWAESLHIETQVFRADWKRNGRLAQILRDDRMQNECTHALCFLSKKSDRLEKVAEKMTKKGKQVFTWSPDHTLTQLIHDVSAWKVSAPVRKSSTKTTQQLLKFQTKE